MGRFRSILGIVVWTLPVLAGCGGGRGGGGGGTGGGGFGAGPDPPGGITLSSSNGQALVDWQPVSGATGYVIHYDLVDGVDVGTDPFAVVTAPPHVLPNLPGGAMLHVKVTSSDVMGQGHPSAQLSVTVEQGGDEKFFPSWWDVTPSNVIPFNYNPGQSSSQNGANLKNMMLSLNPGDELQVGGGTWTIDSLLDLSIAGTAAAPIWITAQAGQTPIITRSNQSQNTVNIGQSSQARYLCLRGLEITGGSIAVRIHDATNVWLDQCHIHDSADNAVAANTEPTDHLYFTRNEVHDTGGTGEGFYLGGNFSNPVMHSSVVALNHVYNTGGSQGDGIEIKQGSWGNLVAENYVHDTNYPCILVYGTDGNPVNVVERNLCIGSGDNVMQVQGEAIVRNNVLSGGANGFYSHDHQGQTRDLTFTHNTIINVSTAAKLVNWNNRPGMTFSNNAVYSQNGSAIQFTSGSVGVTITGNVVFGPVTGASGGYSLGGGLSDFVSATWTGPFLNLTPSPLGALVGAGDDAHGVPLDLTGTMRLPDVEAGAMDG